MSSFHKGKQKRDFTGKIYDEINVTPLIDTLFFLLIIFMLTAPLLEYNIDVTPPELNADKLPQDDKHAKVVNLTKNGMVNYERTDMSRAQFIGRISEIRQDPEAKLYLRADRGLPYGEVIDFLGEIRSAGFKSIFLVTSEESK